MKSFAFNALAGKVATLLVATLLLAHVSSATWLDVVRVSAEYRDSAQFFRISEFFTGRENTGNNLIRRSDPAERAGFYLTVRLESYPYRKQVEEAVHLEVIMPGDIEPTLFTFSLAPGKRRNPLLLIGLTGDDWPDPGTRPLAWRISFLNAAGEVIAREKSFLWSIE